MMMGAGVLLARRGCGGGRGAGLSPAAVVRPSRNSPLPGRRAVALGRFPIPCSDESRPLLTCGLK
eukprot:scaffold1810_cov96-Isochrysis_galbana.AAC.2